MITNYPTFVFFFFLTSTDHPQYRCITKNKTEKKVYGYLSSKNLNIKMRVKRREISQKGWAPIKFVAPTQTCSVTTTQYLIYVCKSAFYRETEPMGIRQVD